MRAVRYERFGGPVTVVEIPEPTCPAQGAVIAVAATGVCRSDWHGWRGHDPDITPPHVPGHEFAGSVVAIGDGVREHRVGERVTAPFVCACGSCPTCRRGDLQVCERQTQPGFTHDGSFAERVVVHHADVNLVSLPDAVDMVTAAALGCRFATAYRAVVHQGGITPGDRVAIFGCGGLGLSAIMIALAHGASVAAVDPSAAARERAEALGASTTADASGLIDEAATDVSIDAFGSPGTLAAGLGCLRPRGRHVQVGLLGGGGELSASVISRLIARELVLLGSHGMAARDYPALLDLIATGRLRPQELVGARLPLAGAPEALTCLPERSGSGIVVLEPGR